MLSVEKFEFCDNLSLICVASASHRQNNGRRLEVAVGSAELFKALGLTRVD